MEQCVKLSGNRELTTLCQRRWVELSPSLISHQASVDVKQYLLLLLSGKTIVCVNYCILRRYKIDKHWREPERSGQTLHQYIGFLFSATRSSVALHIWFDLAGPITVRLDHYAFGDFTTCSQATGWPNSLLIFLKYPVSMTSKISW